MKFTRRTEIIDAMCWNNTFENNLAAKEFAGPDYSYGYFSGAAGVVTREGFRELEEFDWIVKNDIGEFWVYNADDFRMLYKEVH